MPPPAIVSRIRPVIGASSIRSPLHPRTKKEKMLPMKWVNLRWFLAAGSFLLSIKLMVSGLMTGGIAAAPPVIFSAFAFLGAVILTVPETCLRLAEWIGQKFASIFFPDAEFSKPPLTYRLANRYRDEQRWEDAALQYRRIIRYYPRERTAYLELMDVADHLGDHRLRDEYARRYRKRFGFEPPRGQAGADEEASSGAVIPQ